MRGKGIFFIVGIFLLVLKLKKIIIIENIWIIGCFGIWFIMFYIGKHMKNKELNTPRPVYLTE